MSQTPPRPVHRQLSFSPPDNTIIHTPKTTPASTPEHSEDKEEEEDFQMVPLDDDHWTSKEIPERTLCIHEHGLPIPMPLCRLSDTFLHRQPGFK